MLNELRVGIVGLGVMGSDHARNLAAGVRGAALVAVSDADRPRAESIAAELGAAHVFDNGLDMIGSGEIDALIIATPDDTHASLVRAALGAGLAILCEKPLAPTAEEAVEIVALAESLPAHRLSMGFMRRFDQGYRALKDRIDAGADGRLLMTHSVHRNVSAYPGQDSAATITNSAVHEFDILPWLSGSRLVRAQWTAGRPSSLIETRHDPQFVILHDESGVLHTIQLQVHARYGYDVRCEVVCEEGSAELAPVPALVEQEPIVTHSNLARSTAYPADWRPRFADAYRRELQAWVISSLAGTVPAEATTPREALESALVARAVVQSMSSQSAIVDIPTVDEWLAR
ncbi:Gfo/Idh/MocA family oxidoreductase [Flaviflexus equikiangi]|uniref:Gfo/Idh/MocA family oxidoreductase n=1 Tax=Flaviflexus equikiangi TaxID=2758573 RepID=UPI0015F616BE|nr:Gfo/Idh/MocA family oxidoreductase [Flaviflexus equikiangi]